MALTALYLVHGGSDGLMQAWDPLASSTTPIRTLHSRHASRARRRIVQAQASAQGVGVNNYAAGAVVLDPDATVLRGVVALGTHLRYWCYSSSAADQYRSSKRRVRRGERGSNNGGVSGGFSGSARGKIGGFIADEAAELERERLEKRKKEERLRGRFGVELLEGASDEEMLAYAAMLSQESHELEMVRRASDPSAASETAWSSSSAVTPVQTPSPQRSSPPTTSPLAAQEELDPDIAEAIRLSLAAESGPRGGEIPIRQAKQKGKRKSSSAVGSWSPAALAAGGSGGAKRDEELDDLEFALRLSLAEEQSRADAGSGDADEWVAGKGKGRAN